MFCFRLTVRFTWWTCPACRPETLLLRQRHRVRHFQLKLLCVITQYWWGFLPIYYIYCIYPTIYILVKYCLKYCSGGLVSPKQILDKAEATRMTVVESSLFLFCGPQVKWCMGRPPQPTLSWAGCSTITRTGLTLRLTSLCLLYASTTRLPTPSWASSESKSRRIL